MRAVEDPRSGGNSRWCTFGGEGRSLLHSWIAHPNGAPTSSAPPVFSRFYLNCSWLLPKYGQHCLPPLPHRSKPPALARLLQSSPQPPRRLSPHSHYWGYFLLNPPPTRNQPPLAGSVCIIKNPKTTFPPPTMPHPHPCVHSHPTPRKSAAGQAPSASATAPTATCASTSWCATATSSRRRNTCRLS